MPVILEQLIEDRITIVVFSYRPAVIRDLDSIERVRLIRVHLPVACEYADQLLV